MLQDQRIGEFRRDRCRRCSSSMATSARWWTSRILQVRFRLLSRVRIDGWLFDSVPHAASILIRRLVTPCGVFSSVLRLPGSQSTVDCHPGGSDERRRRMRVGFNQAQVQRYLCVPSVREARLFVSMRADGTVKIDALSLGL